MNIPIDKETQQLLRDLVRTQRECADRINLICQTVKRAKGKKGDYDLAADCTALVKRDESSQ